MKIRNFFAAGFVCFLLLSCKTPKELPSYGTFKFKQKKDEVFLKPSLISFLKNKGDCSIVLRVPSTGSELTEEEEFRNRTMYFAIEKILTENKFAVKDRALFNRAIQSDSLSNPADLILELVSFQPVKYFTSKIIPDGAKEEKEADLPRNYYFNGGLAEFKLIQLNTNEVVGVFVLNYTPCTKGCRVEYYSSGEYRELDGQLHEKNNKGYTALQKDEDYAMFAEMAAKLVMELRKPRE
jgi:hypothetical protein